jgi:hypothetical protein
MMVNQHQWQLAPLIECILYCQPVGKRLSYDRLRSACQSFDRPITQFDTTLNELLKKGQVHIHDCDSSQPRALKSCEFFLDRVRRMQFGSPSVTHDGVPQDTPKKDDWQQELKPQWRGTLKKVLSRTLLVAVVTGIGSQVGGWAGAIITALLASTLAVAMPGLGDSSHSSHS